MSIPKVKVGVLGATGAVGQRFVQMLQGHPWFEITALCASERSAGKRYADACTWTIRGDMPLHLRDVILAPCEPTIDAELVFERVACGVGHRGGDGLRPSRVRRLQQCPLLPL